MTIEEKQNAAREEFIIKYLKDANILANWNNREIIIENTGETKDEYPYWIVHVVAASEKMGNEEIAEIKERWV